ncbi:MAG: ThuA domain-containing protein [Anaerolineae bacterium]|nr:ThuA domain-containing protein [Anaerolineae bacterium]
MDRTPRDATVLAVTEWEDAVQPMVYTKTYGAGRVLYIALGHDAATYAHPAFRQMVIQGLRWACSVA